MSFKHSSLLGIGLEIQNSLNNFNKSFISRNLQQSTYIQPNSSGVEIVADNTDFENRYNVGEADLMNELNIATNIENDFNVDGAYAYNFPSVQSYVEEIEAKRIEIQSGAELTRISLFYCLLFISAIFLM